ncbi:MAG: site-specific integrase [bacterium]|nr:site-specific integrase [bacterium]
MLDRDLEAAGIERETESGHVDFHALRVGFITNLARAGVSVAQTQRLARHCNPTLTTNVYSRFGFDEDAAAIAKLPNLAGAAG